MTPYEMSPSQHIFSVSILTAAVIIVDDGNDDDLNLIDPRSYPRFKKASVYRIRSRFSSVTRQLSNQEFRRAFRLSRHSFEKAITFAETISCS